MTFLFLAFLLIIVETAERRVGFYEQQQGRHNGIITNGAPACHAIMPGPDQTRSDQTRPDQQEVRKFCKNEEILRNFRTLKAAPGLVGIIE